MHLPHAFAALGDPTRFAIVERLLAEGEQSAGEISDRVAISAPAVSRHLRVLCDAGVLVRRADKQRRLYRANPEAVQAINAWTMGYREFWEGSLERLRKALERRERDG